MLILFLVGFFVLSDFNERELQIDENATATVEASFFNPANIEIQPQGIHCRKVIKKPDGTTEKESCWFCNCKNL